MRVSVRSRGRRLKCLLLHGNPRSLEDWATLKPLLGEVADVASLDLPGFGESGRSSRAPEAVSLSRLADAALDVLDALDWREPVLMVGHSHGGGVAQLLAARNPTRVAGLVLLGTLGYPAHRSYRLLGLPGAEAVASGLGRLLQRSRLPFAEAVMRGILRDIFWPEPVPLAESEQELQRLIARPEILLSMVHVTLGEPCDQLRAAAARLRCPVSFLHGADDRLVPPAYARRIHDEIEASGGRSRFREISGAGHMLILFQAREIMNEIERWLHADAELGQF